MNAERPKVVASDLTYLPISVAKCSCKEADMGDATRAIPGMRDTDPPDPFQWPLDVKCPCCPARVVVDRLLDDGCCSPRCRRAWLGRLRRTAILYARCRHCG